MKKGFIAPAVLIILALICLFVAATLLFNTFLLKGQKQQTSAPSPSAAAKTSSDETVYTDEGSVHTEDPRSANWKTYKNETFKYLLKVPNDWVIDFNNAKQNNDGLVFIYSGDFKVVGDTQIPHLSKGSQLEILSNFAAKSYTDLVTFDRPDKKEYPNEGKEIIIDGEQAMIWTSDNAFSIPGQKGYQLDVFHNGQGYAIHMVSALPQDILFNQILSTFKFLD